MFVCAICAFAMQKSNCAQGNEVMMEVGPYAMVNCQSKVVKAL